MSECGLCGMDEEELVALQGLYRKVIAERDNFAERLARFGPISEHDYDELCRAHRARHLARERETDREIAEHDARKRSETPK